MTANRKKALRSLEGYINLPTNLGVHRAKVRLISRLPNGNTRVQFAENRKRYHIGEQVTLLPGVFVKECPAPEQTQN